MSDQSFFDFGDKKKLVCVICQRGDYDMHICIECKHFFCKDCLNFFSIT